MQEHGVQLVRTQRSFLSSPAHMPTEIGFVWFAHYIGSLRHDAVVSLGVFRCPRETFSRVLSSPPKHAGVLPLVSTKLGGLGLWCWIHCSRAVDTRSTPSRVRSSASRTPSAATCCSDASDICCVAVVIVHDQSPPRLAALMTSSSIAAVTAATSSQRGCNRPPPRTDVIGLSGLECKAFMREHNVCNSAWIQREMSSRKRSVSRLWWHVCFNLCFKKVLLSSISLLFSSFLSLLNSYLACVLIFRKIISTSTRDGWNPSPANLQITSEHPPAA